MSRPFAVIAGGGTAGHVQPALAVADALVASGHPAASLLFVGSRRGLEARLVGEAGYEAVLLPGRGIPRRLSLEGLEGAVGLVAATVAALVLVVRRRPRVVLAVGGYASLPCAVAAAVLRVPLVLAEQNAVPGSVTRLVGRFARAAAVALPGTDLPRAVLTGNPVRPEIEAIDRGEAARRRAKAELGVPPERRLLLVTSGSLGARRINQAVVELARRWRDRSDLAVHHVIGSRDWAELSGAVEPGGALHYRAVEYEGRMPTALAAADLVLGRAGGSTVSELAVAGVPAVMVPLPIAPNDHQTANARALVDAGAGVIVPDAECDADRLEALVDGLLGDPDRLAAMGEAARGVGRPGAARRVAELVLEAAA